MKIKKLYFPPSSPNNPVVETLDGKFFHFASGTKFGDHTHVTEKDLKPLPGFHAIGNNATEAPDYFYKLYGLEKVKIL